MLSFLKEKFNNIKNKPILIFSIGCFLLLLFSFFTVYFLRVMYEPFWMNQITHSFLLFIILAIISIKLFFIYRLYKKHQNLALSLVIFLLASLFALTSPINQAPDEDTHYLRAVAMADGQFGFDEKHEYSRDVNILMEVFPTAYNNGYPSKENSIISQRYELYYDLLEDENYTFENRGIIIFQVVPYIPQAIGVFIGNIFGLNAIFGYYLARIFNALFFSICAYFAFKYSHKFKIIIFSLMCIPVSLYIVGSNNTDAMLLGLFYLAISCILSQKFDNKKFVIFAVSLGILVMSKANYLVLLPLLFTVNKDNLNITFKNKKLKISHLFIISAVVSLIFYQGMAEYVTLFSNYGEIPRTMNGTDRTAQLLFIISNPLRYLAVFIDSMFDNYFFIFSSGVLGAVDVNLVVINLITPILILINIFKQSYVFKRSDFSLTVNLFIMALLTYAVSATGLYISWAPVTLPAIIGLQMRYFIPAFIGFSFAGGYYFSKFTSLNTKTTDFSCTISMVALNILAIFSQLAVYYIPM